VEHHTELIVVFIACDALILGALVRMLARRTKIPYTIGMLVLGMTIGLLLDAFRSEQLHAALDVIDRAANISPHAIILVFLPALVFESAFALDTHAFRKNVGAVAILALPALLVSTIATGSLMFGLTSASWEWSFTAALMFGALISATDPVAVVAILRETGAPKRLGVLIEGESLLNDGTSIVVFTVLLSVLTAGGLGDIDPTKTALSFLWVVSGGVAVGLFIAAAGTTLIGRTFNDPMVEITMTIIIAYLSMIVAEALLHVSGVLAVVAAGLYVGRMGRTRISPEVMHFLHQFWELLSYIANTLIFFVVGIVIAAQIEHAGWTDLLLVLGTYGGIVVLRFCVTFLFRPLMGVVGDPVSTREATVMAWGGLRGAVSLALALIVARSEAIGAVAPELQDQILLVTAGVVFLTILVNGGTTAMLLAKLGLSTPPITEQMAELSAQATVLDRVAAEIDEVSTSRDLRTVSWEEVRHDLTKRRDDIQRQLEEARVTLQQAEGVDRVVGYWRQVLSVERSAYWSAFGQGTLGATAAILLEQDIDRQLDRIAKGDLEPPDTRTPKERPWRDAAMRWMHTLSGGSIGMPTFDRLALVYHIARAQSLGAAKVLESLELLEEVDVECIRTIRSTYRHYRRTGKEVLEDLRANLPEITSAIETRLAKRIQLNFERDGLEELGHEGVLSHGASKKAMALVERDMKNLRGLPKSLALPETAELCRATPLFEKLDDAALAELADITIEQVLSPGEVLFNEGDEGDAAYVVARGAVHVLRDVDGDELILDVLGGGDVLGEMSLLTGEPRTATIRAATTVTVGKVSRESFEHLMATQPHIRERVWDAFATHQFDTFARNHETYGLLDADRRKTWVADRPQVTLDPTDTHVVEDEGFVFICVGTVVREDRKLEAPAMIRVREGQKIEAHTHSRIVVMPALVESH
jgi:NhaP-type Na+/H+ or K+/H+ antiporter/CRP-like cAMP-binding protein